MIRHLYFRCLYHYHKMVLGFYDRRSKKLQADFFAIKSEDKDAQRKLKHIQKLLLQNVKYSFPQSLRVELFKLLSDLPISREYYEKKVNDFTKLDFQYLLTNVARWLGVLHNEDGDVFKLLNKIDEKLKVWDERIWKVLGGVMFTLLAIWVAKQFGISIEDYI